MNNTKSWMVTVGVLGLIMLIGFGSFGVANYRAAKQVQTLEEQLEDSTSKLTYTMDELITTQSSLQVEVEKGNNLSQSLDAVNAENEQLKADLDAANITIEDLTSDEYQLVYIGNFKYTYYCDERYEHICGYGIGKTASGKSTEVGWTVAADTSVLPMGSIIYVEGVGFREVMDRGGGVKGNHIDILLTTHNECFAQSLTSGGVWVLVKKTS